MKTMCLKFIKSSLLGFFFLSSTLLLAKETDNDKLVNKVANCEEFTTVNIPDANFKAALVGNSSINTNGDGEIQITEATAFQGEINVSFKNISNLTGIEAFTGITTLNCSFNQLTTLNVSSNTNLTTLTLTLNQLTTLDVSSNTNLTSLTCNNNQLTALDVSSNTSLTTLKVNSNQLSTIDLSSNTNLTTLFCHKNQLTALNVSSNTNLTSLNCSSNQLTALDVSSNTNLTTLTCDTNQLTSLDVSSKTSLTSLNCYGNRLTTLNTTGCTSLTTLDCHNNQLTALDISTNTGLTNLNCHTNQLTSLNVSTNTSLTILDCSNNQLATLDISSNTSLTSFNCSSNQLTALDTSAHASLTSLDCSNNQLTSLNTSNNTNLTGLTCNNNQLTALDVSSNTSLTSLNCSSNQLTTLDISTNTNLTNLTCSSNQLTTLDISTNTSLTGLTCSSNQLVTLDVSMLSSLSVLQCDSNQLTSLNIALGNNRRMNVMRANGNANLACIQKDAAVNPSSNWVKDNHTNYSSNCTVSITNTALKTALTANNSINTNSDGEIQDTEAAAYTGIVNIGNLSLTDLAWFEVFARATGLSIGNSGSVTVTNAFSNRGGVTINSDANESGVLIAPSTSNVTYKRGGLLGRTGTAPGNLTDNATIRWSIISSPVAGQKISDFVNAASNDIAKSADGTKWAIGYYDDSRPVNQKWVYYTVAELAQGGAEVNKTFDVGRGYAIGRNTAGSVSFTGTIGAANVNKAVTANHWNAIGNPFTAYITSNKNGNSGQNFINDNKNMLDPAATGVYVWDSSANSGLGDYIPVGLVNSERSLTPGQGFFVKTRAAVSSLTFNIDKRETQPAGIKTFGKTNNNTPSIQLKATLNGITIKTDIKYLVNATIGLDPGYDLQDFTTNTFDLYTQLLQGHENKNFAIQSLPNSNYESMVVPIGVEGKSGNQINFSAEALNFPSGINVVLEDRDLNKWTNLSLTNEKYTINLNNDISGFGRFYIHTRSNVLSNGAEEELLDVQMFFSSNDILRIKGVKEGDAQMTMYNALGVEVLSTSFTGTGDNHISIPSLTPGVYFVEIASKEGKTSKRLAKKF